MIAGQFLLVFTPNLVGRFAGLCLVSVGTGIGEISLLLQAATEFQEISLCSFIVATGVGGILGAVTYVGKSRFAKTVNSFTAYMPLFLVSCYLAIFFIHYYYLYII